MSDSQRSASKEVTWPVVEKFLSPDEILDVLFERLKDSKGVEDFIEQGPVPYHHGFGTGVRNEFWLWHPENPYTMKGYAPHLVNGVDVNPRHADNFCGQLLQRLHAKVKQYHLDKAKPI